MKKILIMLLLINSPAMSEDFGEMKLVPECLTANQSQAFLNFLKQKNHKTLCGINTQPNVITCISFIDGEKRTVLIFKLLSLKIDQDNTIKLVCDMNGIDRDKSFMLFNEQPSGDTVND